MNQRSKQFETAMAAERFLNSQGSVDLAEPETLRSFAERIQNLRHELEKANDAGMADMAQYHWIMALALLQQAMVNLEMASITQARAIAEGQ